MEKVKILFSGLTGKTGRAAMEQQANVDGVEIVMGLSQHDYQGTDLKIEQCTSDAHGLSVNSETDFTGVEWATYDTELYGLYGLIARAKRAGVNALVDFSDAEQFDKVLELAVRAQIPLICGTSWLSPPQVEAMRSAAGKIPIFHDGNCRFKVKEFIDSAIQATQENEGEPLLFENFYQGMCLPSEASRVMMQRIKDATGRQLEVRCREVFAPNSYITDWQFQLRALSPEFKVLKRLHYRAIGFDELAHDILEITKIMTQKPAREHQIYTLDEIWNDLPHENS